MQPDQVEDHVDEGGGAPDFGRLHLLLEGFSLAPSEARVLLALLRLGSTGLKQLSHATAISRSNLYLALDVLHTRGLCHRLPGKYAVWTTPGPQMVLALLEAADAAKVEASREAAQLRAEEARVRFSKLPTPTTEMPAVISLVDDSQSAVAYQEAMAWVDSEILVLNRGPFPFDLEPATEVLDALARGVKARAMWEAVDINDPDGSVRRLAEAYARAGVEQRVIDCLPVALAVLGRKVILLSLPNEDGPSLISFHAATIRHQGMAQLLTAAFDHLWDQAQPFVTTDAGPERNPSAEDRVEVS